MQFDTITAIYVVLVFIVFGFLFHYIMDFLANFFRIQPQLLTIQFVLCGFIGYFLLFDKAFTANNTLLSIETAMQLFTAQPIEITAGFLMLCFTFSVTAIIPFMITLVPIYILKFYYKQKYNECE